MVSKFLDKTVIGICNCGNASNVLGILVLIIHC